MKIDEWDLPLLKIRWRHALPGGRFHIRHKVTIGSSGCAPSLLHKRYFLPDVPADFRSVLVPRISAGSVVNRRH